MKNTDAAIAANFERIVLILDCLGPAYEPRHKSVEITALEEKLEEACAIFCDFDDAQRDRDAKQAEFEAAIADFPFADSLVENAQAEILAAPGRADLMSIIRNVTVCKARAVDGKYSNGAPLTRRERIEQLNPYVDGVGFFDRNLDRDEFAPRIQLLKFRNDAATAAERAYDDAARDRERILDELPKLVSQIKTELAKQPGRDSAAYHQVNVLAARRF